jgi:cytochrome c-type biogenesis protein CcmF
MTTFVVIAGRVSLVVALAGTAAAAVFAGRVASGRSAGSRHDALRVRRAALVAAGACVIAFGLLVLALLRDDFGVAFVAGHHSRAASWGYSITAAWSGLEGSLLLWATMTAVFGAAVAVGAARRSVDHSAAVGPLPAGASRDGAGTDLLGVVASGVIAVITTFFVALVVFVEPVFEALADPPLDGAGTNPLLQEHVMMAIHPPILYGGYIGFVVPFAFACAALVVRAQGPQWVLRTQRWTSVAWTLLTAGILLGGWWSYEVLGWGGYWAWDPVENASLLPWLVGTASLHSSTVHARRGLLPVWSIGLALSSFVFVLLGTFLARSGVIVSVHAFSTSSLGAVLLGFLAVVVAASGWLLVTRGPSVARPRLMRSLVSREGAILINNLLLMFFAVIVLIGTAAPIVVEALRGDRISVGRPFFDTWAVWITFALLALMALAVVAPAGREAASGAELWARVRPSLEAAAAITAVVVLVGMRAPLVILTVFLVAWVTAAAVVEFARAVRARLDERGVAPAMAATLRSSPGWWAGQIAHVGLAVLTLGIAVSSTFAERATVTLRPGEVAVAAGLDVTYVRPVAERRPAHTAQGAVVRLGSGTDAVTVQPELREFPGRRGVIGIPAVDTAGTTDVYVTLVRLDAGGATLQVIRYPLLVLVWAGGLTMVGGGVLGIVLRRLRRRSDHRALALLAGGPATPGDDLDAERRDDLDAERRDDLDAERRDDEESVR